MDEAMIAKYKTISIIYGGQGRRYAQLLNDRITAVAKKERYPIAAKMIMESILTRELLSDVMDLFRESEFCVAFLTADDICVIGETNHYRLRQNVVFEIGMALIQLGRERCILLSDFDGMTANVELPTDMNSLEIRQFAPDRVDDVIEDVLRKILKDSGHSLLTGIASEEIPRYNDLLTRKEYYMDYQNLFAQQLYAQPLEGHRFFQAILESWYEECAALPHYDERCVYLFERLGFLPILSGIPEADSFMARSADLVENYKVWDIQYYHDTELLNFVRDLAANTIEYTRIKTSAGGNKEYLYERLLERFQEEELLGAHTINPLILIVYYDYLGLTHLKLSNTDRGQAHLKCAQEAFTKALSYVDRVDMSMQIWAGFLYFNLARTYAGQSDPGTADGCFKKAIRIRERWVKRSTFNVTIRNALSYEYFLAKVAHLEMCERFGLLDGERVRREFEKLEAELNTYSDFGDYADPLSVIRRTLMERKKTGR